MAEESKVQVGRLAMRREGVFWNAYFAPEQHTMEGAVLLGSILMPAIINLERKKAFMEMMKGVIVEILAVASSKEPSWGSPEQAAEHERSGHG